jgi:V8-like Glu-specific endopeptidase
MKRYNLILIGALCLIGQCALGQISEGGSPVSFSLSTKMSDVPVVTMPPVNTKALIQEDEEARMVKDDTPKPFRFGYAIDVDIDIKKAGVLKRLLDGSKLWMLKIQSENAYSINLIFNRFRLSEGSKFFIYNEDKTMVLGAFTPEVSNNSHNEFATDLVQGNTIVLEYYEPESANDGVINISKVIHGYVNSFSKAFGDELANCHIDVNCPLGDEWENEKRAVSLILTDDNTGFCTGCLVNNTQGDLTPYYLTANHCLKGNTNTWIFKFRYWKSGCGSGFVDGFSVSGATLRANYTPTDFALLELNSSIPDNYKVYYAGWDRTEEFAQNVTGIHHPVGDVMKISYSERIGETSSPFGSLDLWDIMFDQGTVQTGSSGSPLFNQNHKIIGQLRSNPRCSNGSECFCNYPIGVYGKFGWSWEGGGTSSTRLKDWLDPLIQGWRH